MGRQEVMTADEARSFSHVSLQSAAILLEAADARGCECQPYDDWFTYNRWLAQGQQVCRGEHGVKLAIIREGEPDDDGRVRRMAWRATVFCRCQVKPVA